MSIFRKGMNPCSRFELLLEEYLEGTLNRSALQFSEEHLAGCLDCRDRVEDSNTAAALLRAGSLAAAVPDPGFPQRVTAAIRAANGSRTASFGLFWSPLEHFAARTALVAGMAAALLGAVVIRDSLSTPTIPEDFLGIAAARDVVPESPSAPLDRDSILRAIAEGGYGK
jgi:anti-sigma factor RsiW